ncbi:PEP-CTERM sorting domain-containing protein [Rubritalea tangerina]|uniref:PEP-CTERM sorting domain-containing protein n=1 Tax=Rubritalea tangerina TaxID=430798 RepID=A0ABW4Z6L5_9BACT
MNKLIPLISLSTISALSTTYAANIFTNAVDTNFNNASNWSEGVLPTNASNPPGVVNAPSQLTANYLLANGTAVTDIIVNSTLDTNSFELQLRSGGVGRSSDLWIGAGSGNSGTLNVNSGGRIDIAGAGAYMFLGRSFGGDYSGTGFGTVNFESGSVYQVQKGFEVTSGLINFETGVTFDSSPQDFVTLGSNATLMFSELSGGDASTLTLAGANLNVDAASKLRVDFTGATIGETYTLVDNIANAYTNFDQSNFIVNGLDPSMSAVLNQNADSISVSIVAVPEPTSAALLSLAGLALVMRRRK